MNCYLQYNYDLIDNYVTETIYYLLLPHPQ